MPAPSVSLISRAVPKQPLGDTRVCDCIDYHTALADRTIQGSNARPYDEQKEAEGRTSSIIRNPSEFHAVGVEG